MASRSARYKHRRRQLSRGFLFFRVIRSYYLSQMGRCIESISLRIKDSKKVHRGVPNECPRAANVISLPSTRTSSSLQMEHVQSFGGVGRRVPNSLKCVDVSN